MFDASQFLPDYASDHERRVATLSFWDDAITAAIEALSHEKDPATCRADILPWLAWEASADFWDDDWPEAIKREAVAAQWDIHRYKGTRYAIQRALEIMKVRADIVEWFEQDPQGDPGTFEVTAYASAHLYEGLPLLSEKLQQKVIEAISISKPLSRTFSFQLGVGLETEIGLAASGRAVGLAKGEGETKLPTMGRAAGLGVSGRALGFVARDGEAKLPSMGAGFALGAQSRAIMFLQISGELQ
ncbi:phage tail protein I [uncultured Cohaesibacter sp.]|uniref:phage tail protein I n=1 Tax=uncultured Cohaesibacter sp. TaxID=1002546 RepID=UPI002AAB6ED5|nr:phage tail protein I [uncultured Cohaesibacter sp.]